MDLKTWYVPSDRLQLAIRACAYYNLSRRFHMQGVVEEEAVEELSAYRYATVVVSATHCNGTCPMNDPVDHAKQDIEALLQQLILSAGFIVALIIGLSWPWLGDTISSVKVRQPAFLLGPVLCTTNSPTDINSCSG